MNEVEVATPQPAPKAGGRSVVDDVCDFLRARREFGRRKYGKELTTFDGRDSYLDAVQELMDLFVYLHKAQMERAELEEQLTAARAELEQVKSAVLAGEAVAAELQAQRSQAIADGEANAAAIQASLERAEGVIQELRACQPSEEVRCDGCGQVCFDYRSDEHGKACVLCLWNRVVAAERRATGALSDIGAELAAARAAHGPMRGAHEGYAVLLEEMDELWDEVKKRHPDKELMRREAIQVGAMAARFVEDVCGAARLPAPLSVETGAGEKEPAP